MYFDKYELEVMNDGTKTQPEQTGDDGGVDNAAYEDVSE